MGLKGWLSIGGLFCDLFGAFLLSVPVLMEINGFVFCVSNTLRKIRKVRLVLKPLKYVLAIVAAVLQMIWVTHLASMPTAEGLISFQDGRLVLIPYTAVFQFLAVLGVVAGLIALYFLVEFLVTQVLAFARWIRRGKEARERKVGWIGFGILVAGFFLQAYINFLP